MFSCSDHHYSERYKKFLSTPPINSGMYKNGICFGMCVTWLTQFLEAKTTNKNINKYLKMNVSDDFFWKSFSMQRFDAAMGLSPEVKTDFLQRMACRNTTRLQNGSFYELNFASHEKVQYKKILNEMFRNEFNISNFGIIFVLRELRTFSGHAVVLLQNGKNRYFFDPNLGVFDATWCRDIFEVLDSTSHYYIGPQPLSRIIRDRFHYPSGSHHAISVTPGFII